MKQRRSWLISASVVGCFPVVLCLFHITSINMACVLSLLASYRAVMDSMGAGMEVAKYTERLVPSSRIVAVDGIAPAISGSNSFIAPSASVVGNVTVGEHSR